jgi:transcription elongation factor/antiterminator RfaH
VHGVAEVVGGIRPRMNCNRRWYAVRTHPRREALAQLHLERQNFKTFLPVISHAVRGPTGYTPRRAAFFPGYLFTQLDLSVDRWRCINSTTGVARLIEFAGRPVATPEGLIEYMQGHVSGGGDLCFSQEIAVGSNVRVISGPFDGVIGVLLQSDADERVRVLMTLMERQVSVSMPRSSIVVAS